MCSSFFIKLLAKIPFLSDKWNEGKTLLNMSNLNNIHFKDGFQSYTCIKKLNCSNGLKIAKEGV